MNYTFHQLRIFQTVADTGSVTLAGKKLNLTQPAVSIQLRNLQDQFELPLTEIIGKKLHVTEFGEEVLKSVHIILSEVESLQHKVNARRGLLSGRLKIAIASTGKYIMPHFLADFFTMHPGIDLQMDVTNRDRVIESLKTNNTDCALVSVLPEDLDLNTIPLIKNDLFLVGRSDHPLVGCSVTVNHLLNYPLIYREQGSATRMAMEQFLSNSGLAIAQKIELTSNEAVKQAVLVGLGISIMPLIGIHQELYNGKLSIIPLNGLPIRTEWQLVWLRKKELTPVMSAYLEFLDTERERIQSEILADFGKKRRKG
jgi:DNA-binding transcriptional LysR family regulator